MGKEGKKEIRIIKTQISFIVNERGIAEEVEVMHYITINNGNITVQKAIIRSKGATSK